jgi:post-segregation antitoxin (ccd killing protein)
MARVSVYLPEEVADAAHAAGLNVSLITRVALQRELVRLNHRVWLQRVAWERSDPIPHERLSGALHGTEIDA